MSEPDQIAAMKRRREEIRALMASLEQEDAEIDSALKIIERYGKAAPHKPPLPAAKAKPLRPEGIPTNFDMAEMVLRAAEKEGHSALTAREIVDRIGARYWPGVQLHQIQPSLAGFAKHKRLVKRGRKYSRVKKDDEGSDAGTSEPSQSNDVEASVPGPASASRGRDLLSSTAIPSAPWPR